MRETLKELAITVTKKEGIIKAIKKASKSSLTPKLQATTNSLATDITLPNAVIKATTIVALKIF